MKNYTKERRQEQVKATQENPILKVGRELAQTTLPNRLTIAQQNLFWKQKETIDPILGDKKEYKYAPSTIGTKGVYYSTSRLGIDPKEPRWLLILDILKYYEAHKKEENTIGTYTAPNGVKSFSIKINIRQLTKMYCHRQNIGGDDIEAVVKMIDDICSTKHFLLENNKMKFYSYLSFPPQKGEFDVEQRNSISITDGYLEVLLHPLLFEKRQETYIQIPMDYTARVKKGHRTHASKRLINYFILRYSNFVKTGYKLKIAKEQLYTIITEEDKQYKGVNGKRLLEKHLKEAVKDCVDIYKILESTTIEAGDPFDPNFYFTLTKPTIFYEAPIVTKKYGETRE